MPSGVPSPSPSRISASRPRLRGPLPRVAHQGAAAGVLLPAATLAAAARPAVLDHLDVPDLGADPEAAAVELPVDDDPAADAGADRHAHDEPLVATGAEPRLAPGGGVGVVLDDDGQADPLLDLLAQRPVPPAEQVRREVDLRTGPRRRSRRCRCRPPRPRARRAASRSPTAMRRRWSASASCGRGVHPVLREDRALLVDHAAGDLGAADVDADRQAHGRRRGAACCRARAWPRRARRPRRPGARRPPG